MQLHCADLWSPQDAMRSVTKQSIREARLKEIKEELLHSEKLKVRGVGGRKEGAEVWNFRRLPLETGRALSGEGQQMAESCAFVRLMGGNRPGAGEAAHGSPGGQSW